MKSDPFKEIERLQKLPDGVVVLEIGVALQYFDAPPNVRYSAPYVEMGTELWATACYELQKLLCDRSDRTPKEWVDEVVSGDIREISVAVLTALVTSLSIPLSIAVPVTALVIKKGLRRFCSLKSKKPKRTLAEIIESHRRKKKPAREKKNKSNQPPEPTSTAAPRRRSRLS